VLWFEGPAITGAIWIDTDGTRITAIQTLRHPDKLARLVPVWKGADASDSH
jgi:RNA polymerase sigma-70 factor (ECF subfamily)